MVEPITTAAVIGALAVKAAEKAGELFVEKGWENRSALGKFLKEHVLGEDITQLNLNEPKDQGKLEGKVEAKLEAKPELIEQLKEILAAMPETNVVKRNEQNVSGSGNVANQDISDSTITINK